MYIRFAYSKVHKTRNTRQWTFIALLFRVLEIFAGFLFSKTSANKRLFIICLPTAALQRFVGQAYTLPARFPLPRKTLATAKVQQIFELCK